MQPDFGQGRSPTDQIVGGLKRRRWLATFLFAAAFAAIASVALSLPDYYRATASIFVSQDQAPAAVRSSVSDELEPRLYAVTQQVTSRENLWQLIVDENLYEDARAAGAWSWLTKIDAVAR